MPETIIRTPDVPLPMPLLDFDFDLPSAWHGHQRFTSYLISLLRPKMIVELGVYHGFSFLSFCAAMKHHRLDGEGAHFFGFDHWKGDKFSGGCDKSKIMQKLNQRIIALGCQSFASLIDAAFDEAALKFKEGEIDLIHFDGAHAYEDIKHDWETWLPKLSPQAVALFHDTQCEKDGFGVKKYFTELTKGKECFLDFPFSYGLGVYSVSEKPHPGVADFFRVAKQNEQAIYDFFKP